jgi:hypothetical protein
MMVENRLLEDEETDELTLNNTGLLPTISLFSNLPANVGDDGENNMFIPRQIANRVATMAENKQKTCKT